MQAWLFAIARNAVNDHFRSQKRRSWLPFDAFLERPDRSPKSDAPLLDEENRHELLEAVRRLDEREREIIALKFGAAMTNRAIAAQMGLGESHVAVILHRSVKKLQAALEEKP